jgi:hypothetical protein
MKYAIVVAAWLIAGGVLSPQGADAGFVPSVDETFSAVDRHPGAGRGDLDVSPSGEQRDVLAFQSLILGVIELPSGAPASSSSNGVRLTHSASAVAIADANDDQLNESSLSSRLPPECGFSLVTLLRSSVFRPPRA